jgi:hypothetical protein
MRRDERIGAEVPEDQRGQARARPVLREGGIEGAVDPVERPSVHDAHVEGDGLVVQVQDPAPEPAALGSEAREPASGVVVPEADPEVSLVGLARDFLGIEEEVVELERRVEGADREPASELALQPRDGRAQPLPGLGGERGEQLVVVVREGPRPTGHGGPVEAAAKP